MTQWSDLPREIQVEIIKFAVADILQDHIDRVPPGFYWGTYPEYIATHESGLPPQIQDRDDDNHDYEYERDIYTELGDGVEIHDIHESSRFTSMLVVSKAFLTPGDFKNILLQCGHISCPRPQHLSQFKDGFTSKQRKRCQVMWVRPPPNIPLIDRSFLLFGPADRGLSLYRCLLYFPNLKLVNLQLEQYLTADVDIYWTDEVGRLERPTLSQQAISLLHYKDEQGKYYIPWLRDLLLSSVVLNGKVELRLSFEAKIAGNWYHREVYRPVATFSSKDFCVRVNFEENEWVIKQPHDEQENRERATQSGRRSSFEELPKGLLALMSAKARD